MQDDDRSSGFVREEWEQGRIQRANVVTKWRRPAKDLGQRHRTPFCVFVNFRVHIDEGYRLSQTKTRPTLNPAAHRRFHSFLQHWNHKRGWVILMDFRKSNPLQKTVNKYKLTACALFQSHLLQWNPIFRNFSVCAVWFFSLPYSRASR